MKTHHRYLLYICLAIGMSIATVAYAGTRDYLIVEDLPFINDPENTGLGGYLRGLFQLGIGIAVTLAIVMLVVNGIQYMFSDIPGIKSATKDNFWGIVWGLILAFSCWLILYTINPNIIELDFIARLREAAGLANQNTGPTTPPPPTAGCGTCTPVPSTLPMATMCGGQTCMLDPGLIPKLETLKHGLRAQDIEWHITEAWPATFSHDSPCHNNGTCIDANFRGTSPTAENINTTLDTIRWAGLSGVYEVTSQDEEDRLKREGVSNVEYNKKASAAHFHIQ